MRTMRRVVAFVFVIAIVLSAGLGVMTLLATPAEAGRCLCPQIYAPVVCAKGKVYPNQCVADCHNARDCVPTGTF